MFIEIRRKGRKILSIFNDAKNVSYKDSNVDAALDSINENLANLDSKVQKQTVKILRNVDLTFNNGIGTYDFGKNVCVLQVSVVAGHSGVEGYGNVSDLRVWGFSIKGYTGTAKFNIFYIEV